MKFSDNELKDESIGLRMKEHVVKNECRIENVKDNSVAQLN